MKDHLGGCNAFEKLLGTLYGMVELFVVNYSKCSLTFKLFVNWIVFNMFCNLLCNCP